MGDYGYQITGVAKRTSIADGNTWNHEHIATLGRILTSAVDKSHKAMRHLADYLLVWAGGHGDDMGKSPHLARSAIQFSQTIVVTTILCAENTVSTIRDNRLP